MDAAYKFAEDDGDYLQLVERAASRCGAGLNAICAGSAADPGSGGGAMKFGLVNPAWTYEGSTYFGCQDPHYPLELLFAEQRIRANGHEPLVIDAHLEGLDTTVVKARLDRFQPDFLVIPTAPSYLFWRCPPPELRVPQKWFAELGSVDAVLQEVDTLMSRGVDYIYWIDEIFGVGKPVRQLLGQLSTRRVAIGLQTRIDLWDEESLDLLGRAHCISMECGIESITDE